MKVIEARNVHEAFIKGIHELKRFGIPRDSRNGPVLVMPEPVTTVYAMPEERVIFWPQRDANPFFHLYEALWMLTGRRQVEPLLRYTKNMANYADDGIIHGAYGYRWRYAFNCDQLKTIIERLQKDPNDRRCVLQMWDTKTDLNKPFKDLPCNTMATFQRDVEGRLDMAVFCRSNDIIWGAYGANAVHFSFLQEYIARGVGCQVGRYYQVSVNWHAYVDTLEKVIKLAEQTAGENPYQNNVCPTYMPSYSSIRLDMIMRNLTEIVDTGFEHQLFDNSPWAKVICAVLRSHYVYKATNDAQKAIDSMGYLLNDKYDWVVAAREWLERRVK